MRVLATGDTHGEMKRIEDICIKHKTSREDILVILGDSGFNYYLGSRDKDRKELVSKLPITIFCVHGNHEERPRNISTYEKKQFCCGQVYYERAYPNILFGIEGEIYKFGSKTVSVIGGAYSVDKEYRLMRGWNWFESEQLTSEEKHRVEESLNELGWKVDIVLSHTCPYEVRPTHLFLDYVDQSKVDSSMERWLQLIADKLEFGEWYFGHYHDNWRHGDYQMLFDGVMQIEV